MTHYITTKASGFRLLSEAEFEAVSGGVDDHPGFTVTANRDNDGWVSVTADDLATLGIFGLGYDFLDQLLGGGGGEPFVTVQLEPEDLDGDGEPGITVTPPPIQTIGQNGEVIYVRLFNDGGYIEYDPVVVAELFNWLQQIDYVPVESGTYTYTYNPGTTSIGIIPPSISFTFPNRSITLVPDRP